jgi:flagella basal body P-ring formation protein FlgA
LKKSLFFAALLALLAFSAPAISMEPVSLEGLQVRWGEGTETLSGMLRQRGGFPWSGITMEPGSFPFSGEIVSPKRIYPGTSSAVFRIRTWGGGTESFVARLTWHAPMVLALEEISRGSVITGSNAAVQVAPYRRGYGKVFCSLPQVEGKRASRDIRAGEPLSGRNIEVILLVERRDPVVVISKSGAVIARLRGVALEGGDLGDVITVRVPRYRNEIPATVIDKGLVEAAAGL